MWVILKRDWPHLKLNKRWGFIDKYENIKVQPLYSRVTPFHNGLSIVTSAKGYNMINQKGKKLSSQDFEGLERLENGKYLVTRNNLFGLLDTMGQLTVNVKYEYLKDLDNSFCYYKKIQPIRVDHR